MKHPKTLKITDFTYELPEEKIAFFPKEERDASKLLVYRDGIISEDIYRNIAGYIRQGSMMVFNETRVVNVRLLFRKPTGALIEVFCLEPDARYPDIQVAMQSSGEVYWKCLVGGAAKWKKDTRLSLYNEHLNCTLEAQIVDKTDGLFLLRLFWDKAELSFATILEHFGHIPLPPYISRDAAPDDKDRYQTIFASQNGSVAAPTAGLHFTAHIMETLNSRSVATEFITLHVGAGTFQPVKSELISGHQMHAEWIDVELGFIKKLLEHKNPVIAVGTTSMRTLESLYWIGLKLRKGLINNLSGISVDQWDPYELPGDIATEEALTSIAAYLEQNGLTRLVTQTRILIAPGYQCRVIRSLVTNFHQPGSTLLLLVAALAGDDWKKIYQYALNNNFRFLSYGDGCLINF